MIATWLLLIGEALLMVVGLIVGSVTALMPEMVLRQRAWFSIGEGGKEREMEGEGWSGMGREGQGVGGWQRGTTGGAVGAHRRALSPPAPPPPAAAAQFLWLLGLLFFTAGACAYVTASLGLFASLLWLMASAIWLVRTPRQRPLKGRRATRGHLQVVVAALVSRHPGTRRPPTLTPAQVAYYVRLHGTWAYFVPVMVRTTRKRWGRRRGEGGTGRAAAGRLPVPAAPFTVSARVPRKDITRSSHHPARRTLPDARRPLRRRRPPRRAPSRAPSRRRA
jgi:hypothetical protein